MVKTISDVGEDWSKLMFDHYVGRRIKYSPEMDNKFVRCNFSYGMHPGGTFIQSFTSDIDNTATTDTKRSKENQFNLTNWLVEGMGEANKLLRRIREKLHNYIFSLPKLETESEVKDTLKSFYGDIAKCRIHRSEFLHGAEYAADNVELVESYDKLIEEADDMDYIVNFLTGSPWECGFYLLYKRLRTATAYLGRYGIEERIHGSRWEFDPDTKIYTGQTTSGIDEKPKNMKQIHRSTGCDENLSIFLTDDQIADGEAASLAGFAIYVDVKGIFKKIEVGAREILTKVGLPPGDYRLPGKHSIYFPEARNSMNPVIELIKYFKRYVTAEWIMMPESELELYNLVVGLKESYKNALRGKEDYHSHKDVFIKCANQIVSINDPIVTERSLNISGYINELWLSTDRERDKTLMENIKSRFEERIPEMWFDEKSGNALREIVKEKQLFRPEEWWFRFQKVPHAGDMKKIFV
jgi:hypothetical protein